MTYYKDLTPYSYVQHSSPAKNVGWLSQGEEFETAVPSEKTLDALWNFCSVPVMQTRGFHRCEFCSTEGATYSERNGVRLLLGTAEIRVFSRERSRAVLGRQVDSMQGSGLLLLSNSPVSHIVYAAPTLIYHYVETHHYKPPDEFLVALKEGSQPLSEEYQRLVDALQLLC